jgi:hypothetical protein
VGINWPGAFVVAVQVVLCPRVTGFGEHFKVIDGVTEIAWLAESPWPTVALVNAHIVPDSSISFLHDASVGVHGAPSCCDVSVGTHFQRAAGPATASYFGVKVTVSPERTEVLSASRAKLEYTVTSALASPNAHVCAIIVPDTGTFIKHGLEAPHGPEIFPTLGLHSQELMSSLPPSSRDAVNVTCWFALTCDGDALTWTKSVSFSTVRSCWLCNRYFPKDPLGPPIPAARPPRETWISRWVGAYRMSE